MLISQAGQTAWHILGNTAQALLDPTSGLVEHYEACRAGIEVTWLIARPPEGRGGVEIVAEVSGLASSQPTSSGVHFLDERGRVRLKMGTATAVDRTGRRWSVAVVADRSEVRVLVPEAVLAQARYPLAVDPLISAELEIDQPVAGPTPCTRTAPAVAVGPAGALVVWTHGKGEVTEPAVCGARFDPNGNLLDPCGLLISSTAGEQTVSGVAAAADGYLVVWSAPHGGSTTDWDILGARVRADGTVADPSPLPVCTVAVSVQCSPTVAANGENYLVVWRDSRSTGIYGAVVGLDGSLASTNGMPICTAAYDQYAPAVAALGTNYLVVWQDYRKATSSRYEADVYGARVSGEGVVIDTANLALGTHTNSQYHPMVAANGEAWLVVWEDYGLGGNEIRGTRVTGEGAVLDPDGLMIGQSASAQANPAVTGVSGGFLVAWQDYRNSPSNEFAAVIYGARVRSDGSVLDPDGLALSTNTASQVTPAVAGRGDEAVVVWQDHRDNPLTALTDVQATRLGSVSNAVLQSDLAVTQPVNGEVSPAVAAIGGNFLVVWADNRNALGSGMDIYGARLDVEGTLLDPAAFPICVAPNRQTDPAVAANGTNYLVVWSDRRRALTDAADTDIYGTLVGADGNVHSRDGIAISVATNDQSLPAATALGDGFLVVWQDARSNVTTAVTTDIYGARIDAGGTVLDPEGIVVSSSARSQVTPAVAAGEAEALVVWSDFRNGTVSDIYGAHVSQEGVVREPDGIAICRAANHQSMPAVAAIGNEHLVVWTDARRGSLNPDIYGAHAALGGAGPPTNDFPVCTAAGMQTAPAATAQGPDYLIVWQDASAGTALSFDIYGARIAAAGTGSATPPYLLAGSVGSQLVPALAARGNGPALLVCQGAPHSVARTTVVLTNLQRLARLDSGRLHGEGWFEFRLWGAPGARYQIEVSEDLLTWTADDELQLTGDWEWSTDLDSQSRPCRFYRAVLLP